MKSVLVALALVLAPGCFGATVRTTVRQQGFEDSELGVALLYGLIPTNVTANCPHGLAKASSYQPWWAKLVTVFTVGLVTPIRMTWVCADRAGARGD